MANDYDLATNVKAYERWAPWYDKVYTNLLSGPRRASIEAAVACGPEILEVGLGTGLSLPEYPANVFVTGIDLSPHMLEKAQEKIDEHGLKCVRGLSVMDACNLGFADASFDAVSAQFVLTLVPDPEQALDEFARVCKPSGEIIIANHIGAEGGPMALVETLAEPVVKRLGWRPNFQLQRVRDWADNRGFSVESVQKYGPIGYFTVIRLKRRLA